MSSDEIDIEEHDVLDDPRLRHLLPDLARVKSEAPDYEEGTPELGYEPFASDFALHAGQSVRNAPHYSESAEYGRHQNKIILGSKPSAHNFGTVHSSETAGRNTNVQAIEKNCESVLVFGKRVMIKQEIDQDLVEKQNNCSDNILGSKPSEIIAPELAVQSEKDVSSNEDVHLHRENANPGVVTERIPENCRVALENWGPKLQRSLCYCKECKILFATRNALDAHKMAFHSFLVAVDNNRAMKSTSRSFENFKTCAQCNQKFANDSLLVAHVYEHLAAKIAGKNKEKDLPKPLLQAKHSNKISLGSKPSSEVSFTDDDDGSGSDDDDVSGFYRCSVCSYYLKNVTRFYTHNLRNHFITKPRATKVEYDKNCRFCSYRNNRVMLYNKHISKRHVDLYIKKAETFIPSKTIQPQPGSSESICVKYQCMQCSLILQNQQDARNHRKLKHPELKSEFIIKKLICRSGPPKDVQKIPETPPTSTKRKGEDPSVNPKKAKLDPNKGIVYYCEYCKCTMLGKRYLPLHIERKCNSFAHKRKLICITCGLPHSTKSTHTTFHEKNPDKTIHDFQFVRLQDNALINAPMPEYPRCKHCGVHALSILDLQKHECGADYKTCRFCKKKFADDVYSAHIEFHTYIKRVKPEAIETTTQNMPEIPEILKKYEMLTETWNILYLCATCNIVTDSYDKAVEHSQNHFNNLENYDVTIKQCHVCRLMFDEPCLERHKDIHKENQLIDKESFRILSYDYTKLQTKDWFSLFGNLSNSQIQRIVSRSIYAFCRSIKMTIFLDGAPELTLYQCRICRLYVHPPSVPKHKLLVCLRNLPRLYCNVCNIPFCSVTGRDAHLATHGNRGSYRHVIFNAPEDADFDAALSAKDNQIPKDIINDLKKKKSIPKYKMTTNTGGYRQKYNATGKLYTFYECTKCRVHLKRKDNAWNHKCSSRKHVLIKCNKCGLKVYTSHFRTHKMKHETHKSYVRKNMQIVNFTPKAGADGCAVFHENSDTIPDQVEKVANLIKCNCGLHFTSKKTYAKHSSVCSPQLKIARKNCKECGYTFDALEMFRHKAMHHNEDKHVETVAEQAEDSGDDDSADDDQSNDEAVQSDNADENDDDDNINVQGETEDGESGKHKLYRCGSCNLLFHVKVDIVRHLSVCDPKANKENKCVKCGLSFYSTVLTHMLKVNNCNQLTEDDYDIVTLFPRETAVEETDELPKRVFKSKCNWVYKCWKCDVHWVSNNAVTWYHYVKKHAMNFKVVECEKCGLNFPCSSIKRHQELHHKRLKLTLADLHIEIVPEGNKVLPVIPVTKKKKSFPMWSALAKKAAGSGLLPSNVCNRLYRCNGCQIMYLSSTTRDKHVSRGGCGTVRGKSCKICKLVFNSSSALSMHISIHHESLNMKLNDYDIQSYNSNDRKLYFCRKCPLKFMRKDSLKSHLYHQKHDSKGIQCPFCHYTFTAVSLPKHKLIHHQKFNLRRKDFILITMGQESTDPKTTPNVNHNVESMEVGESKIRKPMATYSDTVYKCKVCSLHFVSIYARNSHMRRKVHNKIQQEKCSICSLAFGATSLKKHQYIHHKQMKLRRKDMRISIGGRIYKTDGKLNTDTKSQKTLTKHTKASEAASSSKLTLSKLSDNSWMSTLSDSSTQETPKQTRVVKSYTLSDAYKAELDGIQHDSILYKCKYCGYHFMSHRTIQNHFPCSGTNRGNPQECSVCRLIFSIYTLSRHFYVHHEKLNLELEDLQIIVVKDNRQKTTDETAGPESAIVDANDQQGAKPTTFYLSKVVKAELDQRNYDNNLYKCNKCGRHFLNSITKASHFVYCLKSKLQNENCSICGLAFSSSTLARHFYVHHEKLKLGLKDFNIITNKGGIKLVQSESIQKSKVYTLSKASKAEINLKLYSNKLYKCVRCGRHFLNITTRKSHDRNCSGPNPDDVKDCSVCGLTFTRASLSRHVFIHHEKLKLELEDFEIIKNISYPSPKISSNSYEFDGTYSRTLQRDDTSEASSDRTSAKQLRKRVVDDVSESSFDLSRASSAQNLTSELDSSRNDDDGLATPISTEVIRMYKKYPVSLKVLKSLDISVYDNKIYHCTICGACFLLRDTLTKHLDDNRHLYQLVECDKCQYKFSQHLLPRHDYIQHGKLEFAKEDLQVIDDRELQRTLNKCVECNAHFLKSKHKCVRELHKCIICDLMFTAKSLNPHYERHHRRLKLSAEEFIIIEQTPGSIDSTKAEPSTSECLDMSTDKLEFQTSNDVEEVNQITMLTPPKAVPTSEGMPQKELSLENLGDEPPNLELSTLNPNLYDNKLFKCKTCSLHFLVKENYEWHLQNSDHISVRKIHCTICNLAFSAQTLATHTFVHHERLKLGANDFVITDNTVPEKEVSVDEDSVVSQSSDESIEEKAEEPDEKVPEPPKTKSSSDDVFPKGKYTTKLYKCSECKVHFLSQASCYKHTYKNHTALDPLDYIACKICGLEFGNVILPKHVTQHHKNKEFNLDQVLVEAYTPRKEAGAPKIDIYLAIDKVQSKLVSTTTEKEVPVTSSSIEKKEVSGVPESTTLTDSDKTTAMNKEYKNKEQTVEENLESTVENPRAVGINDVSKSTVEHVETLIQNVETNKTLDFEPIVDDVGKTVETVLVKEENKTNGYEGNTVVEIPSDEQTGSSSLMLKVEEPDNTI